MAKFFLSFHNGMCRISHGANQELAITDCLQTAAGTGMTSDLLGENFKKIGSVIRQKGSFVFEKESVAEAVE